MKRTYQVDLFMETYAPLLEEEHARNPDKFNWRIEDLELMLDQMRNAFYEGRYNPDNVAVQAACVALGIPPTRKGMEAFFNRDPEA